MPWRPNPKRCWCPPIGGAYWCRVKMIGQTILMSDRTRQFAPALRSPIRIIAIYQDETAPDRSIR